MRSRKKLLWIGGSVVVLLWLGVCARALLIARREAQAGLDRLDRARIELTPKDLLRNNGTAALREAHAHFSAAYDMSSSWYLAPLRIVPYVGQQVGSVDSLASGANDITRIGSDALTNVRARLDAADRPQGKERVAMMRALGTIAVDTKRDLARIGLGPDRWLVAPLKRAHDKFDKNLGELRTTVTGLVDASAGIADFLAGPRTYLVIAANNSEMRVGSGAFLSLGELTMRDGKFHLGTMEPASTVAPRAGAVDPGKYDADFKARFGGVHPTNDFRELAVSPRFEVIAPLAVDMWKSHGGHHVDGVLVLDPVALQGLLRATGPVTVEGKRYSANNLLYEVFVEQYRGLQFDPSRVKQIERRDKLSKIARAAIQQLEDGKWKTIDLFDVLRSAAVGRHILAWSAHQTEQDGWLGAKVAGYLPPDAMLLSVQNRGGNKLDQFVTSDATITERRNSTGTTDVTVDVKMLNAIPLPITEFPPYVIGPYYPSPTSEAGKYVGNIGFELPKLATSYSIERDGAQLGYSWLGSDGPDHQVIAGNFELRPGDSTTISVHFQLPAGVSSIVVFPTSRILNPVVKRPAVTWKSGTDLWNDEKSHRVTFAR